jgi:hypothetical protein
LADSLVILQLIPFIEILNNPDDIRILEVICERDMRQCQVLLHKVCSSIHFDVDGLSGWRLEQCFGIKGLGWSIFVGWSLCQCLCGRDDK